MGYHISSKDGTPLPLSQDDATLLEEDHLQAAVRAACNLDAALSPQSRQCMRMPPKRPIRGSGDAGAAKAPEHGVDMETEVAVTTGELSLHPDIVDGVELPQPEAEFHTDSGDD